MGPFLSIVLIKIKEKEKRAGTGRKSASWESGTGSQGKRHGELRARNATSHLTPSLVGLMWGIMGSIQWRDEH